MANTVPGVVKNKIDTASNLASWAVAPLSGELVIEYDTKKFKYGDGSTLYSALPYGKSLPTTNTAAEWISANPVLLSGEWGKETDTGKMKNGDGVTAWNSLTYSAIPDIDTKISTSSPQICKAWCNFDGTLSGTIIPASGFNVSNITKNGTGDYTVNFTSAMSNANYSCIATSLQPNAGSVNYSIGVYSRATMLADSVRLINQQSNGAEIDSEVVSVQIFAI
ncbi:MAG: hypothetical protein GY804_02730 [Alphaproteobacteria bacterium]|nr:hypothetical protein [Alphaproteobacteria bacterium]